MHQPAQSCIFSSHISCLSLNILWFLTPTCSLVRVVLQFGRVLSLKAKLSGFLLQTPKHSVHVLLCFLETGSCSVGYAGLELTTWPRLASGCWSNKYEPSHEALLQHLAYLFALDTSLRKEKTADQFP